MNMNNDKETPDYGDPLTESSPDWQSARMLGRREALNIILEQNAEDFPDDFQRSCPIGDTGDFRAEWREDKLAELLDAKEPSSLIEHLAGIRWEQAFEIVELKRERDEARAELAAMRDAIKEAYDVLKQLPNYVLKTERQNPAWSKAELWGIERDIVPSISLFCLNATAKLQPFTTPRA